MKKILFAVFLSSILAGCTNSLDETITLVQTEQESGYSAFNQHFVTLDAVTALTGAQMGMTRNSSDIRNRITCYTDTAMTKDTLLFICDNNGGGWTMYSSDTRVPPIVAQSGSGTFAEAMENENAAWWIKTIAEDMKRIRRASDHELNFSKEEIENNANFWESVSAPDKFVKEHLAKHSTRGEDDLGAFPIGHYELIRSTYHTEVYDSIPRLTTTNWGQYSPYNDYCPNKHNAYGKSPAGCTAIAGAQMLYFLHYKLGVPQTAPSAAYCNGDNTNYDWAQTNYTTEIWDIMNDNNGLYAAPFIANIGGLCETIYGNNESAASFNKLVNKAFTAYGINCTLSSYNEGYLRTCLSGGMPVILGGRDKETKIGHAFIADRYKRVRGVRTNLYEWVYDYIPTNPDGSVVIVPAPTRKTEITYTSPTINMIGMNWGLGSNYFDPNEWFTLTGNWLLQNLNFTENREMIHEFEIINNQ